MKHSLLLLCSWILVSAMPPPEPPTPHWTARQASRLVAWLVSARDDGLGSVTPQVDKIESALRGGDPAALDAVATRAAIQLLEAYRHGCCNASLRSGWHIADSDSWRDAAATIAEAVADDGVDALFKKARPSHPLYNGLRTAYARESDPGRRATLAVNLDRWRWMPRALGQRYLLVNTAAFEASLWDDGQMVGRWKVVVGKTKSPTPIFSATVTGVTLNPWWEIPADIAAENIAALVRDHPQSAAAKGYVLEGGNALGKMKLVMPNSYHVYLHDTPSQSLFAQDVRAYSHGCVRVGDALGLVTALLSPGPGWSRTQVEATVASGRTQSVKLQAPIPVYVAYFTAEPDGLGGIRYFPDIYRQDRGAQAPGEDGRCSR